MQCGKGCQNYKYKNMRKNRGKKREKNISEIIIVERDSRREKRKEFKG